MSWKKVSENPPEYEERVLVYDANSHVEDEPCRKAATLISKTESKNGVDYTWQVENEQPRIETFQLWHDLPEIPIK